jgi:hypothetical protein
MDCARVKAAVSGFEPEFCGRIGVRTVPVDTDEGKAALKMYAFQSHGLVLFDSSGQLIYKRRDHLAQAKEVTQVVYGLLGKRPCDGGT